MKVLFGMTAAVLLVVSMLVVPLPGTVLAAKEPSENINKNASLNELLSYIEQGAPQKASPSTPGDITFPGKPWWAVWFLGSLYDASVKAEFVGELKKRLIDLGGDKKDDQERAALERAIEILIKSTLNDLVDVIKNVPGTSITGPPPSIDKLAEKYIEELLKEWIKKELTD